MYYTIPGYIQRERYIYIYIYATKDVRYNLGYSLLHSLSGHQQRAPADSTKKTYHIVYRYTLWYTNIAMENHNFQWVNPL